ARAGFDETAAIWFEHAVLRGTLVSPQAGEFAAHVRKRRENLAKDAYQPARVSAMQEQDWAVLSEWAVHMDRILLPLVKLGEGDEGIDLQILISVLTKAMVDLGTSAAGERVLGDAAGAMEFEKLVQETATGSTGSFVFNAHEATLMLDALLEGRVSRKAGKTHSRLHIYGPLEVRLLDHDRVILAGLNEGTWPQTHRNDPFLNRTLRRQLDLPSPERRTGLAAHDFQQLLGKSEVVLSRSAKVDKAPAVASRWVQRLLALLGDGQARELKKRGSRYLELANALDETGKRSPPAERPAPTPPVEARPTSLAVTDIETWIRDPYALYAKKVLKLRPLEPLEREPDPLLKGTLYHGVMEDYVLQGGPDLAGDRRVQLLVELLEKRLAAEALDASTTTEWQVRFEEIAQGYVAWETERQKSTSGFETLVELEGRTTLAEGFTLRARADRIDVLGDGSVDVFDYKTGKSPTPPQARTLSPQLALEALIAERNGFEGIDTSRVNDMRYLRLRADAPVGKEKVFDKDHSIADIISNAADQLEKLIIAYRDERQGYVSRYAPFKETEMRGDYDHLARVREWSFGEEDGDD
ncbi:MAG: double-strand break repair protein AddB, partial [Pseudomonadota bacterium]